MTQGKGDLLDRMRARAVQDGLPEDHELRQRAAVLDQAMQGYFCKPPTVPVNDFMKAWFRARRAWCTYTGEPLL